MKLTWFIWAASSLLLTLSCGVYALYGEIKEPGISRGVKSEAAVKAIAERSAREYSRITKDL